ncbi:hypothetical protein INE80_00142 [Bacteroides ovatus]|nr:hypothetical protein INE80_00142 [Bacteroides ovatus]
MKFFLITYLCASLYVDIYKSLISPHISEVQKVCGLNSNSCNPFFFLMIWYGVFWVAIKLSARYTSDALTDKLNISLYSCIKSK